MSLTVSPEVAEHIRPGEWTPIQLVEGEPQNAERSPNGRWFTHARPDGSECGYLVDQSLPICTKCGWLPIYGPPAWLVALRDARCDHIADFQEFGTGSTWHSDYCPRCVNGRKLVEVRVEPSGCAGCMADPAGPCLCDYRSRLGLIDVVPVIDEDRWHGKWPLSEPCIVAGHRGYVLFNPADAVWEPLTPAHVAALTAQLGRPIEPGMFAVAFEAVER